MERFVRETPERKTQVTRLVTLRSLVQQCQEPVCPERKVVDNVKVAGASPCCASDGGWPSGLAVKAETPKNRNIIKKKPRW